MVDQNRQEVPESAEVADRDSRAEALLVDGLDRYFSGRYDEAIHLWTRVLFLDRSHARARAYIDRARTALAERQRRADEMLQTAGELLAAGHTDRARALLGHVISTTGDDERAAALRSHLERAERVKPIAFTSASPVAVVDAVPLTSAPSAFWSTRLIPGAVIAASALMVVLALPALRDLVGARDWESDWTGRATSSDVRVLSSSEVALVRARTLYAHGRLAEVLQALDRIDPESANRSAGDALRVEIQQVLLAASRENRGRDGGPQ